MENGEDTVAMEQHSADGVEQATGVDEAQTPTKTATVDEADLLQLADNNERTYNNTNIILARIQIRIHVHPPVVRSHLSGQRQEICSFSE